MLHKTAVQISLCSVSWIRIKEPFAHELYIIIINDFMSLNFTYFCSSGTGSMNSIIATTAM
jgi:hypothetical protein